MVLLVLQEEVMRVTKQPRFARYILLAVSVTTLLGTGAVPPLSAQTSSETSITPIAINTTPYTYASAPLETPVGSWRRIQISGRTMNEAVLSLDPNRISWDGYSPTWISTRMAEMRIRVKLSEVKGLPARPVGRLRVYDVRPQDLPRDMRPTDLGLPAKMRLVVADDASGPFRLLLLGENDRVDRIISLERQSPTGAMPLPDDFSLQTALLNTPVDRANRIGIKGSLKTNTAELILDANATTRDAYGDPGISTLMLPLSVSVRLVEKTDLDEDAKKEVRVFDIEGGPQPMRLVLSRNSGGPHRLVVLDSGGRPTRFLSLEPTGGHVAPLMGATWRLESVQYSDDKKVVPPSGLVYNVQFLPEGRIAGRADNNRFTGTYTVAGPSLTVSPLAMTRMANVPGSIAGEFLRALQEASSFKVEGRRLLVMLKVDSGTIILTRE